MSVSGFATVSESASKSVSESVSVSGRCRFQCRFQCRCRFGKKKRFTSRKRVALTRHRSPLHRLITHKVATLSYYWYVNNNIIRDYCWTRTYLEGAANDEMVRDDVLRHRVHRASGHGGRGHQPFEEARLQFVQVLAEHLRAAHKSLTIVDPTHFHSDSGYAPGMK